MTGSLSTAQALGQLCVVAKSLLFCRECNFYALDTFSEKLSLKSSSENENLNNRHMMKKFNVTEKVVGVAAMKRSVVNLSLKNGENKTESIIKLAEKVVDNDIGTLNNSILVLEPDGKNRIQGLEKTV